MIQFISWLERFDSQFTRITYVSGGCRIGSFCAGPLYAVSFLAQFRWERDAGSCPKEQLVVKCSCYMYIVIYGSIALCTCRSCAPMYYSETADYPLLEIFLGSSIHME